MNKRTAKVVRINKSLLIVLPKDWTRGMGIEAGQEVDIIYNGEVHVRPKSEEGAHES